MSCQLCNNSLKPQEEDNYSEDEEDDDEDRTKGNEQIKRLTALLTVQPFVTEKHTCDCSVHRSCWDKHVQRYEHKPRLTCICQIHSCTLCKKKKPDSNFDNCSCTFHKKCWSKMNNEKMLGVKEEISAYCSQYEPRILPHCSIHDCALCRTNIRKSYKTAKILKCGCYVHHECMTNFPPIMGTHCPVCLYKMYDEDLKEWKAQGTLVSNYLPLLSFTSDYRALLFNRAFLERRTKYELMNMGVTVNDFLVASFTFMDFLDKIVNSKGSWKDATSFKVEPKHIDIKVYEFLMNQKKKGKDIPLILEEWGITFVAMKKQKYSYKQLSNTEDGLGYTIKNLMNQKFTKDDFFYFPVIEPEKFKVYFGFTRSFLVDYLELKPSDYNTLFNMHDWTFEDLVKVFGYHEVNDKKIVYQQSSTSSINSMSSFSSIFSSFIFSTEPATNEVKETKQHSQLKKENLIDDTVLHPITDL